MYIQCTCIVSERVYVHVCCTYLSPSHISIISVLIVGSMDTNSPSPSDLLVDHLLLVGPGKGLIFDTSSSPGSTTPNSSWYTVHTPQPSILRSFPDHRTQNRPPSLAMWRDFCQPDGCSVELQEQRMHQFMLTDTNQTNEHTAFVSLFLISSTPWKEGNISRGAVSVALNPLTRCYSRMGRPLCMHPEPAPVLHLLPKALVSLQHFVEHFFGEDLTWNASYTEVGVRGRREGRGGRGGRRDLMEGLTIKP